MNEEIMQILEMVKNQTITPEEGEKLLSAINQNEPIKKRSAGYSMLRIRVDTHDPDKNENAKVNVNIPLSIAKKAASFLSVIPKEAKNEMMEKGIDLEAIDLKGIIEMIENGEITEEIVDVKSGDDETGTTVKVYVD